MIDRVRLEPLCHLPALVALALAASAVPARSQLAMVALCAGGSLPVPAQPRRDCDPVCHVACARDRKSGRL